MLCILLIGLGMPGPFELLLLAAILLLVLGTPFALRRVWQFHAANSFCTNCFRYSPRDYRSCSNCGQPEFVSFGW